MYSDKNPNVICLDKNGNPCPSPVLCHLVKSRERYVKSSSVSNEGKSSHICTSFKVYERSNAVNNETISITSSLSSDRSLQKTLSRYNGTKSQIRHNRTSNYNSSSEMSSFTCESGYERSPDIDRHRNRRLLNTQLKNYRHSYRNNTPEDDQSVDDTDQSCIPSTSRSIKSDSCSSVDFQKQMEYNVGVNLFNIKPDYGINYFIKKYFVNKTTTEIALFLMTNQDLSRQKVGEYLGNLRNKFVTNVVKHFLRLINLSRMEIDEALRKCLSHFWILGEAQRIEFLIEEFSKRYSECNPDVSKIFKSNDTVFLIAFSIILLNTDLHTKKVKNQKKMTKESFIKNLRGVDGGNDIDEHILSQIYDRIQLAELKPNTEQLQELIEIQSKIMTEDLSLVLPHRRLVSHCSLYEISDPNEMHKKCMSDRQVYLFNDLLLITKTFEKTTKQQNRYLVRTHYLLSEIKCKLLESKYYSNCIHIKHLKTNHVIILKAKNYHDKYQLMKDLEYYTMQQLEVSTFLSTDINEQ